MDIGETLSGIRAPVTQQSPLDMVQGKWLAEEGIPSEVDHSQTHVERGVEVVGHLLHLFLAERLLGYRSPCGAKWRYAEVFDIFDKSLRIGRGFGYHGIHGDLLGEYAAVFQIT